jgi:ribosomal protein S18 acetylase RimI-like enzyme
MRDGQPIIDEHPHPVLRRLLSQGYELFYDICPEGDPFLRLKIEVRWGSQVIGHADCADNGPNAHCQNVAVIKACRRGGVATAMYVFAEAVLGK